MQKSDLCFNICCVLVVIITMAISIPIAMVSFVHAAPELAHAIWGDEALIFAGIQVCEILIY